MTNRIVQLYYQHRNSFLTFLLTGIGTTITYVGLFSLFWYVWHINHIASVSMAFILAAAFQFFANRHIAFKGKGKKMSLELFRYLILLVINYVLSVILMQLAIWLIDSALVGLILTALTTPITGYLIFSYWIFKGYPKVVDVSSSS